MLWANDESVTKSYSGALVTWQLIAAVDLPSSCRIRRSHSRLADKVIGSLCEDPMGRKDGIEARE